MKPLIGITCSMGLDIYSMSQEHMPAVQHRLSDNYVKAIIQAGGVPVIIPSCEDESLMADIVDGLDGILLSGGGDVDPVLYGQRATGHLGSVTPLRDTTELAIARYAIEKTNKPVLGICRGIQVMNVAMGGTLHIDLTDAGKLCHNLTMYPRHMTTHCIEVARGTLLADIMGAGQGKVNSYHHQAVDALAPDFLVTAVSVPDQVIEAIELPGRRYVLGVQWHPEGLIDREESRNLFRSFVAAAAK